MRSKALGSRFVSTVGLVLLACLILAFACGNALAATIHVATTGSDTTGNGSPTHPYKSVTKGMTAAAAGDTVSVAAGTYATSTTAEALPINLKSGVTLRGSGASATMIQGGEANNFEPVVVGDSVDARSALTGFTIMGGDSSSPGGGVWLNKSNTTVSGNIIRNNKAFNVGSMGSGPPALGAGICCIGTSAPTITGNTIRDNVVDITGSDGYGGGIYCAAANPTISNNVICANDGGNAGGAIYCASGSPKIINNTIVGNTDTYTTTEYGGIYRSGGTPVIRNCVIWGNGDDLYGCSATYSDIQDPDAGTGNNMPIRYSGMPPTTTTDCYPALLASIAD